MGYTKRMSHKAWVVIVLIAFVVAVGAATLLLRHPVAPEAVMPEAVEVNDLAGKSIYVSGEYGFTFVYASALRLEESLEEIGEGKTIAVVELHDGEDRLRIEIDTDAGECVGGEDSAESVEIAGALWHRFAFGTETGYETARDGVCIRALMRGESAVLNDALQSFAFPGP